MFIFCKVASSDTFTVYVRLGWGFDCYFWFGFGARETVDTPREARKGEETSNTERQRKYVNIGGGKR